MVNSETKLIGLLGHPVKHSKSPQMHNHMFRLMGLNNSYLAFDVEINDLAKAIAGIRGLQLKGCNVTIPHKVDVMKYLDEVSEEADQIGAVNTIVNDHGKLIGYNTDGEGYVRSLIEEAGIDPNGKSVLILGAGGAARAISYTFFQYGIKQLFIINRNRDKAEILKQKLDSTYKINICSVEDLKDLLDKVDIIVNTTSIGMHPNIGETLIKKEWIKASHLVSDIIYNPLETQLLKDAKEQGATTHSGLGMFVYQGVIAFEKWTGMSPDPTEMKKAVLEALEAK